MARLNWTQFAKSLVDPLRELGKKHAKALGVAYDDYKERVDLIEEDVEKTLAALETATNPTDIARLKTDLDLVLPARRAAVEAIAISYLSSEAEATFKEALEFTIKAAVIAAKAFI